MNDTLYERLYIANTMRQAVKFTLWPSLELLLGPRLAPWLALKLPLEVTKLCQLIKVLSAHAILMVF